MNPKECFSRDAHKLAALVLSDGEDSTRVAVLESARHKSKADVEMIVATLHPQPSGASEPAVVRAIAPEISNCVAAHTTRTRPSAGLDHCSCARR